MKRSINLACYGLAAMILALMFVYTLFDGDIFKVDDEGNPGLLKLDELKARHHADEVRWTALSSALADPNVHYVCQATAYVTITEARHAAFANAVAQVPALRQDTENTDQFTFFDRDMKLLDFAYYWPGYADIVIGPDLPISVANLEPGYVCMDVEEGVIKSYVKDDRFYFSLAERAPENRK